MMMKEPRNFNWQIALAAQTACILEVDAPKAGNVNRFHDFSDATLEDFHRSALAIGRPFGYVEELGVGRTVYEAVKATRSIVTTNTNLGIVLLLAPLGMAWRRISPNSLNRANNPVKMRSVLQWKYAIQTVMDSLTVEDTFYVYKAIRLASPSGMGTVKNHDVYREEFPAIPLTAAMKEAAERDLIARQYCDQFNLILSEGYETLVNALAQGLLLPQAIAQSHLYLLSRYPDSLITRKCGHRRSREVRERAGMVWEQGGLLSSGGKEYFLAFDHWLRQDGHLLNPGTTADLTAAILFVYLLENEHDGTEGKD